MQIPKMKAKKLQYTLLLFLTPYPHYLHLLKCPFQAWHSILTLCGTSRARCSLSQAATRACKSPSSRVTMLWPDMND